MVYKPVNKYVDIEEQTLNTPERRGFTVVEWGGTEIEHTDLKWKNYKSKNPKNS